MPKPTFNEEPVIDIVRHAVFLHEVAHPDIAFSFEAPDPSPLLVCDRRLLGQAVTNVIKNGIEAIQQKREEQGGGEGDRIGARVVEDGAKLRIEVTDSGVGLPAERGRLTEPYMTTRAKGTGLGLAIVKKIVEDHLGQVEFEDARGGGSLVRFSFDSEALRRLAAEGAPQNQEVSG
jgi:two-component system nitrogen regulation sensor histidine kinase NtrY